jgi:hypothetical protein
MKRFNRNGMVLFVSLFLLVSGLLEQELFAAANITELHEQNYRKEINASEKCIVMYYAAAWKYTAEGKAFMKELQSKIPSARYFTVDLKKFEQKAEVDKVFAEDISVEKVPSLVGYARGRVLIRNAGVPLTEKETKEAVSAFIHTMNQ